MLDIEVRVKDGAAFLDEKRPGWADEIDLETLDVADGDYCVLAQLYDDYNTGYYVLGLDDVWDRRDLGFSAIGYDEYPALTDAWHALITERRAA
ncbi:hypothetical protein E1264_03365 [Actinomadura sp. KC216]|uniref:hypothetical protein n=1 Tax=Actinomadura sp. KC216 TaxID=2530370 RepID=UPI001047477A|nr:hypothetical protein [Actinomadura sp. KC216]TDB90878.1 hypothetical protein E1264_03365 [Actinomadura sp. KC216]